MESDRRIGWSVTGQLASLGQPVTLSDGESLFIEGDTARAVYVVTDGTALATRSTPAGEVTVAELGVGELIGDVTAVAGGTRTATVRARGDVTLSAIDGDKLLGWLDEHPGIAADLAAGVRRRLDRGTVAELAATLIGDPDAPAVGELLDRVEWRRLAAGEVLCHEGDPSDGAYLVVSGRLVVTDTGHDGAARALGELGRGEVVGELELFGSSQRIATVTAVRETTLAGLSRDTFEAVAAEHPAAIIGIARTVVDRATAPPRLADRAASLVLASTRPIDRNLIDRVISEIGEHGSVDLLTSDGVDELLGRRGLAQAEGDHVGVPRLEELLHGAERRHDRVVLRSDDTLTPWTQRILGHADRVVVLTAPRPSPEERELLAALLESIPRRQVARMVAVVHPPTTDRPRNTAALLDGLDVDEIVHVRHGDDGDAARLARLAIGRGVGLLMSGGGARGFAHLGAHRALLEAGVPIDAVGGASIGAPLGAGIAQGTPQAELVDVAEGLFHRLLDFTVPVVSLLKGERITKAIDSRLGDWDIEDLWLPFFCVSTNLTTAQQMVHRRGSSSLAVRASVSIPGVLPPVPHDGDLLVDGGVLDNLPIGEMAHDRTIGTIVAVDVAPPHGPRAKTDFGRSVSGFRAAVGALTPWGQRLPDATGVMVRSMLVGSAQRQQAMLSDGLVDLLLPVHVSGIGLLDFERVRDGAEVGYRDTVKAIREWAADRPWTGRRS